MDAHFKNGAIYAIYMPDQIEINKRRPRNEASAVLSMVAPKYCLAFNSITLAIVKAVATLSKAIMTQALDVSDIGKYLLLGRP